MTPEQLHALMLAAKPAGGTRDKLVAGRKTPIDFTVRVHGELIVNHASTYVSNNAVPVAELLAGVLAEFGPRKRKSIVDAIVAARSVEGYTVDPKANEQAQRLIAETTTKNTGERRGAVTGKIEATLV